jgi:hypothetical protein
MWIDSLTTDLAVRFSACVRTNDHTARAPLNQSLRRSPPAASACSTSQATSDGTPGWYLPLRCHRGRPVDSQTDALRATSTREGSAAPLVNQAV